MKEETSLLSMINVSEKATTRRTALASGEIELNVSTFRQVIEGRVPKGDVFIIAEVAGISAAKMTSTLLPLCHPLGLDHVRVSIIPDHSRNVLRVESQIETSAKTGVEMEALCAVSGALLCIYDMTKALSPHSVISAIQVQEKYGGTSDAWNRKAQKNPLDKLLGQLESAILIASDSVFQGRSLDGTGPALLELLTSLSDAAPHCEVIPDEKDLLIKKIQNLVEESIPIIIIAGGTGPGPKDITPDAIYHLNAKEIPGLGELMRSHGANTSVFSWLSRSLVAVLNESIIIAIPGSPKGAVDSLKAIIPLLPHALNVVRGLDNRHGATS